MIYLNCYFFNNIGTTWYKLGSTNSPQPPSFENCYFDINFNLLSGCLTLSCSFQLINIITFNFNQLIKCNILYQTVPKIYKNKFIFLNLLINL